MTIAQKLKIYEDALLVISKLAGKCWDGNRVCTDSSACAGRALKKVMNSKRFKEIDDDFYYNYYTKRDGSFHKYRK